MTAACTSNLSWSMYPAIGRSIYQTSLLFVHWIQLACSLEIITWKSWYRSSSRCPVAYPSGWYNILLKRSAARPDAIEANPGRVTVHCWSSVRLETDCIKHNAMIVVGDILKAKQVRFLKHGTLHQQEQWRHCRNNTPAFDAQGHPLWTAYPWQWPHWKLHSLCQDQPHVAWQGNYHTLMLQ
jgi:hypothetical protein